MRIKLTSLSVLTVLTTVPLLAPTPWQASSRGRSPTDGWAIRTLDGQGNNPLHASWGGAGEMYLRMAPADYADEVGRMESGPPTRWLSNRVFNDLGQNLFSENGVSQWGWVWGQFLDHDMGLRDERLAEPIRAPFSAKDPLERFANRGSNLQFFRTPAASGTGVDDVVRQQRNTLSSFIDGSAVYGTTTSRTSWLRKGAHLLLPGRLLPMAGIRGRVATAPVMDLFGPQTGRPHSAVVAGDVRANENAALTAVQTLFAREHNRIVDQLPAGLADEQRFQIARRVVGAEIQRITYEQFLPAMGVRLPAYDGYEPWVNPTLTNEFATVGFRSHSMVHGEFETTVPQAAYTPAQVAGLRRQGLAVSRLGRSLKVVLPLPAAFGNPGLLRTLGVGTLLASLGERQYKNDEQIDDTLRSVLFQVPRRHGASTCTGPVVERSCFTLVSDLGAVDVLRQRDHGIPGYNELRKAYGLPTVKSFRTLTGERTKALPKGMTLDSRNLLRFTALRDDHGRPVALGSALAETAPVVGLRASTTAARLKAIYHRVGALDAFVGMSAERHLPGSELGPLQNAMWTQQFTALRNGDRFFYLTDHVLAALTQRYGVTAGHTLSQIIALNTGHRVAADVFHAASG